jgi:hypothetical protein
VLVLQPPVLKTSQCLSNSSVVFLSKGKKQKNKKTKTKQKNPKFKYNSVSVSPSASCTSSVIVSSKEEKKNEKGSPETAL